MRQGPSKGRTARLTALLHATRVIVSSLEMGQSLQAIIEQATIISGATAVRLFLLDGQTKVLRYRAGVGLPPEQEQNLVIPVGESFSGEVVATGKALAVADTRGDPRLSHPQHATKYGLISYLGLPVKLGDRILGVLVFNTQSRRTYSKTEIDYLSAFADHAALAIENARLFAATERRAAELATLREIGEAITSQLDLPAVLEAVVAGTMRLLENPFAQIILWDETTQTFRFGTARGNEAERVRTQAFKLGRGINGMVAQNRQPMILDDYQASPYAVPECADIVATITVPILFGGRLLGVLHSHTTQPSRRFTADDLRRLQVLSTQAAIAIENARLYEEVRRHAEEMEGRVRRRTAELEEALRVKAEFLGKMSHELRTPLNFVIGFSELLQQGIGGPLTPKQATYIDRVLRGGRRLLDLVSDVLDIAQVDVGKIRLQLESVVLRPVVQEVLELAQIRVAQKGLKVITALDPWLPFIVADRFKLVRILHNLLDNAVKFTPEGGTITLSARKLGSEEAKERVNAPGREVVEIVVEDTGIGIPPADREAIFGAFQQGDSSETRTLGGAGLGLALVRKFVELHGGRVWAESPGLRQGSRFVVRLPRLEIPKAKRILLVEDEPLIRLPLASALETAGFVVVQAETGADGLAVIEAEALDLLILDVVLPDLEGWRVLQRVREVEEVRVLPVLVVAGPERVNAEKALALGADEFLTKPVSPRVLVDTVMRLLSPSPVSNIGVGPRPLRLEESGGK